MQAPTRRRSWRTVAAVDDLRPPITARRGRPRLAPLFPDPGARGASKTGRSASTGLSRNPVALLGLGSQRQVQADTKEAEPATGTTRWPSDVSSLCRLQSCRQCGQNSRWNSATCHRTLSAGRGHGPTDNGLAYATRLGVRGDRGPTTPRPAAGQRQVANRVAPVDIDRIPQCRRTRPQGQHDKLTVETAPVTHQLRLRTPRGPAAETRASARSMRRPAIAQSTATPAAIHIVMPPTIRAVIVGATAG
jgi:hypothetical protein